ncbi:MAG: GNAT family N-acetyltransferase [Verrucomicrobia bacterium]|nr:GNAT family N-acetyltransferase [Verrucomicrobiota bacterium]
MKTRPTLETDRLCLRPFAAADASDVQRLAGDRAVADTTLNIPHPYEDGVAEDWIGRHQGTFVEGKGAHFAITLKTEGTLVGAISLMGMVAGHQAELGYWIGRPYWNKGYCTEAGRAVVAYAFSDLGLIRVHCCHLHRNPASGRVMQKIGMSHEGCRRQHVRKWDKAEDLELYGILREEWNGANKAVDSTRYRA